MAIAMKEKEKNLLIQSFEYGESNDRNDDAAQSAYVAPGSNQVSTTKVACIDRLPYTNVSY